MASSPVREVSQSRRRMRIRAAAELKGQGVRAFLSQAEREERDHPLPQWSPWLKAMPGPCLVCEVKDTGRDWTSWNNVHGHLMVAHGECVKDPVRGMLGRA